MKQRNTIAPLAGSSSKKAKKTRQSRAQRRAERHALISVHKRPIVCPPDRAGRHPLFRLGGIICRALVIWLAASGLLIFVSDALELGVASPVIFLTSLVTVALVLLFLHSVVGKLISVGLTLGGIGALLIWRPLPITDIPASFISLFNAALTRLHKVGYLAYEQYKVDITRWSSTDVQVLMTVGVCLLTVVFSVLFAACFAKRAKPIVPAIITSSVLVVMLTFNIYSNRIESNLGIALIMVSFASVLVMVAYDRIYHAKDGRRYDTELRLFEDIDRPTIPAEYQNAKAARLARREAKAALRQKRRAHVATVEEELDDYFGTDRRTKKKQANARATAAERKAARRAHRDMLRRVRAARSYDRVTEESRTAMGGYASAAVLVACLIAIALPALLIKGNFSTIDAIDEKMELARSYVTALLRGDDNALDRLEYQADRNNFKPHSTDLEQLEFTGKQIFYIRTRYNTNYYLRGWLGTDYVDGAWLAVDDETLKQYHDLFGKDASPSEEMRYNFYHYMMPSLVDDPAYTENFLTKYASHTDYGFVGTLVSLRRVNSPSTLTYFPASFAPQYGIYDFPKEGDTTLTASPLTYVNYYDGIYTGRKFNENGLSYSAVAYAPVMKNKYWIENQANLQATFNLQKEVLLARTGFTVSASGEVSGDLTLEIYDVDPSGLLMFKYTLTQGKEKTVWRFFHESFTKRNGCIRVSGPYGDMEIGLDGKRVISANYLPHTDEAERLGVQNMVEAYERTMTDAERTALMNFLRNTQSYNSFVYDTYLGTSDSTRLEDLTQEIVNTPVVGNTYGREIDSTDSKDPLGSLLDYRLAAAQNASSAEVYMERDRLVRHVIDYIIENMGCTYTIEPDLTHVSPDMDGVENFLFNTREGYCVQFASAVTLILRELGIPARYAEGYVANDLTKLSRDEFIYGAYVRDYQTHAWVEVYFDGIGWIQYETTPQYYAGMYGSNGIGSNPVTPILPVESETETDRPQEPDTEPETEMSTTPDDESEESTNAEDVVAGEVTRVGLIGLGVLAAIAAVALLIYAIVSRARAAEAHRQDVVSQVLDSGFGPNTSEEDRREMALEMVDAVTELLRHFDLSPHPGEFRDEYAERLLSELRAQEDGKKPSDDHAPSIPDLHMALDGMAAEEFGHGMTIPEMKQIAALYLCLRREIPKRLSVGVRFKLRYVKRKI